MNDASSKTYSPANSPADQPPTCTGQRRSPAGPKDGAPDNPTPKVRRYKKLVFRG